jgi:hypothetical protein
MKYLLLISLFLSTAFQAPAQTPDSISIHQETGTFEEPHFATPYEQVFQSRVPARWLLKADLTDLFPFAIDHPDQLVFQVRPNLKLSAEFKLSPSWSLNATYGFGHAGPSNHLYDQYRLLADGDIFSNYLAVEPRYYYHMAQGIKAGQNASNFSGNYLALQYAFEQLNTRFNSLTLRSSLSYALLRYGIQRRLFKYGFFDISWGAGVYVPDKHLYFKSGLYVNQKVSIGLSLAPPNQNGQKSTWCDALNCFQEENHLWKINFFNVLQTNSYYAFRIKPEIAYEHKLGSSSCSVETTLGVPLYVEDYKDSKGYFTSFDVNLDFRWYFGMKRRVALGKSGNNLNGVFTGIDLFGSPGFGFFRQTGENSFHTKSFEGKAMAELGIHYHLFRHAFAQIKFLTGPDNYQFAGRTGQWSYDHKFITALEFKTGLAF